MPKKLLKCVRKVMAQGKDRSTAIAICVKSTGLKMKHSAIEKMLDDNGVKESYMKVHKIRNEDISETIDAPFANFSEANIDSDNFMLKDVCTFGTRHSANNRVYQDKAIEKLSQFTEGGKCFLNHISKSEAKDRDSVRDIRDWVGVFESPRKDKDRIFANLRVRESYFDLLKDIALLQPTGIGMSINARVKVYSDDKGVESVVDVDSLKSTDLVASAATTTSLWESVSENIEKNLEGSLTYPEDYVEMKVTAMFNSLISEGVIQDKIDGDEVKREISNVTWTANDLIDRVIYDDKMSISDKKSKVMAIFDDLNKEVKNRLGKIKTESIEEDDNVDLTLEAVKGDKGIMEALLKEFEEKLNAGKMSTDLKAAQESNTELTDKVVKLETTITEMGGKITALEAEKKVLEVALDKVTVAEALAEKKALVERLVAEAKLPKEVVTSIFMETLMGLNEIKDGEEVKESVEDQMKKYIEDRKTISATKGVIKGSGDEFILTTESKKKDEKKGSEVKESDVDNFVKSAR